ncbi:MAG: protein kinase, partial [Lachnospiraceae bacterium]|nr:protein kinase [Lachnospiraceae bacterium]
GNGTVLNSRYRIDSYIGQGGFGITYKGFDTTLDRVVAIKEYFPEDQAVRGFIRKGSSSGQVQVFSVTASAGVFNSATAKAESGSDLYSFTNGIAQTLEEAKKLARYKNDGIVKVLDFFEENGTAYIVMDYIEGPNLMDYVNSSHPSVYQLFDILKPVFSALKELHKDQIYHRDIAPDNILVSSRTNRAVLIDFGSARDFSANSDETHSPQMKGEFTAIEQLGSSGDIGPWTDIYSLGVTIYEMLCLKNNSSVRIGKALDRSYNDTTPFIGEIIPELPPHQANAIMKAIGVRKNDRWQEVQELEDALYSEPAIGDHLQTDQKIIDHTEKVRKPLNEFSSQQPQINPAVVNADNQTGKSKKKLLPVILVFGILAVFVYFAPNLFVHTRNEDNSMASNDTEAQEIESNSPEASEPSLEETITQSAESSEETTTSAAAAENASPGILTESEGGSDETPVAEGSEKETIRTDDTSEQASAEEEFNKEKAEKVLLSEVKMMESTSGEFKKNVKDFMGEYYDEAFVLNEDFLGSAVSFYLGKQYSVFEVTFDLTSIFYENFHSYDFEVYGDENLLEKFVITETFTPLTIELDVKDVEILRFYGFSADGLIFGDACLYKANSPDETNSPMDLLYTMGRNPQEGVPLNEIQLMNSDKAGFVESAMDTAGYVHNNALLVQNDGGLSSVSSVILYLGGDYADLDVLFACPDDLVKSHYTYYACVYADDERIDGFDMSRNTVPFTEHYQVKGVKKLKFEVQSRMGQGTDLYGGILVNGFAYPGN